jgi:hypothetical protein
MKRCSKCRRDQAVRGIRKYKRGDGYQPWCKTCRKDYDHAYWQRNKERWAENKQAWFKRRVEWLREMKTDKACTDCGGIFPPEATQWDHLPGTTKLANISTAMRNLRPKLVFEELAKCELVSANCHAIRTYRRLRDVTSGV